MSNPTKNFGMFTAEMTPSGDGTSPSCFISYRKHSASLQLCQELGTVGDEPGAPSISQSTLDSVETWALRNGW